MIHFLTTALHAYTVRDYLKSWAGPSHPVVKMLAYETLPTVLPRGTYIFCDLERLSSAQLALAGEVWIQLEAAGDGIRLLNNPLRAARRLALLERLYAAGRNTFRAYRATEPGVTPRFPVFVRQANEHTGSLTGLLRDQTEVDQAVLRLLMSGVDAGNILIVEFSETGRDGLYKKYSGFRVGDRIVPRHLIFSAKWVVKVPDLVDATKVSEERAYLDANPHERELREIFNMANIDYGRIDYSVLDGRIQVWEINTNPVVMLPRDQYQRAHIPNQEIFARQIRHAFQALDSTAPVQPMVMIKLEHCARRLRDGGGEAPR